MEAVSFNKRKFIILAVVVGIVAFVVGLLIGLYAPSRPKPEVKPDPMLTKLTRDADPTVSERLINDINRDNIGKHLKKLTERPHLAGIPESYSTAEYVRDQWKEQGYDVEMVPYDVLLSYPEDNHNNTANLLASDGTVLFTSRSRERAYSDEEATQEEVVQPYNAFSASGNPESELVYVNYGRDVDFENLTRLGVNVSGKIVIARYGKIFRGNKLNFAYQYGAIGMILYTDPKDYTDGNVTYPDNVWLPPTAMRRGNVVTKKGDQATPGYPATCGNSGKDDQSRPPLSLNNDVLLQFYHYPTYAARLTEEELTARLPKIPSQPIGYEDAYYLLREMGGDAAPAAWQGGLNITYRLGGTMIDNKKVQLDVKNYLKTVTIYNVFAKMKGTIEADKVVLMGNHRDAWVYGGTDPSSGTATMLEMSRVYAQQVKNGWQPRRSVIFCSWDAEEFGLVGSIEWVEDNVKWLSNQAVAYLNVDLVTSGNFTPYIHATPSLKQAVFRATKKIPDPHQEGRMVYDVWSERFPDRSNPGKPLVLLPGAGSDYVPFEQDVGIPTTDAAYAFFKLKDRLYLNEYPTYHSLYDGYRFATMVDPEFRVCKTLGAYLLEVARDLIDSPILPIDPQDYATQVHLFAITVRNGPDAQRFAQWNITFDAIFSAVLNFSYATALFHSRLDSIDKTNPIEIRAVNEKLMTLEKAFQIHTGLPVRKEYKHVLLTPSSSNYYSATTFPGMEDLLYQIGDDAARWEQVRKHLSVLTFTIQSAAKILLS